MNKKLVFAAIAGISLTGASAMAEDVKIAKTIIDSAKLYENKENSVLQSFALSGRLQGDYFHFEDDDDLKNSDTLFRRFRFGVKAKVFGDFTIHAEMDLDANEIDDGKWDEIYNRLTDSYAKWEPSDAVALKVGKQSAGFTLDGASSSKKLIVPERNIVAGNLWFGTEYFTGVSLGGDINDFFYKVGGFSASEEAEFGHFDNGYFGLLSAGHKVGNGKLRLDYVYNDPKNSDDWGDYGTPDLEHVVALVYTTKLTEKLGLDADLAYGAGLDGASDLFGGSLRPFYDFTDNFQFVIEYAAVTSLDDESVVNMSRYAGRNTPDGVRRNRAEESHNLLAGFNWYLYGHKLKWQNAVEYNYGKTLAHSGEDYKGYGFTSALRLSW